MRVSKARKTRPSEKPGKRTPCCLALPSWPLVWWMLRLAHSPRLPRSDSRRSPLPRSFLLFFFGASFCVVARNAAWRSLPFLESANDDDAAAACTTPLCCCCWWWHACTRCSSVAEHCRTWCQETARGGTRERKAREQARAHQTGKGGGMGCCVQAAKHSVPRANFEAQDCARRLDGRIVCACVPGLPGRHAGFPRDWRCGCCHRLCHRRAVCPILVRSTRRRPSRRVPEQGPRQDIASHVLGATQGRCAPHVSPPSSAPRPH